MTTTRQQKALRANLEHALAEALTLVESHTHGVLSRLETRMERRDDGNVVIRFEWEVGAPRAAQKSGTSVN
ncbi:hypothetical protein ACFT0G_25395 [Streptomyces sp. NPDC057020]|uniref:hypothetical protein n=1 Tax=unclassified Streptomyces TaxID=2593676 RepID=UPI0036400077